MVARPDSSRTALQLEEQGFDGVSFVDSQNLSGDVYVAMTTAVQATEILQVSSGVTNPVTRHPAVTAGAAASARDPTLSEVYGGKDLTRSVGGDDQVTQTNVI